MASSVARIRTVFTGVGGSPAYSNLYFDDDGTAAGVYQSFVFDMWSTLKDIIDSRVTLTMVNPIPIIDTATGQTTGVVTGDGGTVVCTSSGDPLPPATSGLVQLHTGVFSGGREIRGRCFIPYPTEGQNTAGLPTSGYKGELIAAFEEMNGISGANGALSVYSRVHHGSELVTSIAAWDQWASLRSRRD
jgi:hypothetical protein